MLLLFKVTVTNVHSINDEDFDIIIQRIFPSPPPTDIPENPISECTYLPYYYCNNKTNNSDGTGLIDMRFVLFYELHT